MVCVTRRLASAARIGKRTKQNVEPMAQAGGFVLENSSQRAWKVDLMWVTRRLASAARSGISNKQNVEPMAQAVGLVLYIEIATCQSLKASLEAH